MTDSPLRVPPVDLDAERAVLGAWLLEPECGPLLDGVSAEVFHQERHRDLLIAMQRLRAKGDGIDGLTVRAEMIAGGTWRVEDGETWMARLIEAAALATRTPEYLALIQAHAQRRDLITLCRRTWDGAFDASRSWPELLARHVEALTRFERGTRGTAILTPEAFAALLRDGTPPPKLALGLDGLDTLYEGGFSVGDLHVMAGQTGIGKTQLAVQILREVSITRGLPGLFVSCEMDQWQIGQRLVSIGTTYAQIAASGWHLWDITAPTITELTAKIRAAVRAEGLVLVVVDHLLKVRPERPRERRDLEVAEVVAGLRDVAKAMGVPVLGLHQLGRDVSRRNSPRPRLSDLRESSAVEQEAASVLFVWSTEEHTTGIDPLPVTVTLEKHRHGPTGQAYYRFHKAKGQFTQE